MEFELLTQIADISFPIVFLVIISQSVRKVWSDFWPWFTGTYWIAREARWERIQQEQAERDRRLERVTDQFLGTLQRYQNGYASRQTEEHRATNRAIAQLGNVMAELFQAQNRQLADWHRDTIHLIALVRDEKYDD